MAYITIPASQVRDICKAFNYRKRKVNIHATDKVVPWNTHWCGGSKSDYTIVNLETGKAQGLRLDRHAPWDNPLQGVEILLQPNMAVVVTGYFCGQISTMTIHVHPSNMPALLGN